MYLLILIFMVSLAFAVPPGQAKKTPEPEIIVVQNQTGSNEGVNWEFVGALVAIIAAAAAIVGWLLSRRERGTTAKYLKEINNAFNAYKNNTGKAESALYSLKEKIDRDFEQGKIKESAFSILDSRIDKYLSEVRKDVVSSQFNLKTSTKKKIDEMLADGVISKEEYEKFSKMDLNELSSKDRQKLKSLMNRWKSKSK